MSVVTGAELVPSREAAERLGVSQQEVRRLVKAGVLRGTLVANRVMVDRLSLERRARQPVSLGPHRTSRNAWAMLRMLSSVEARFVDPVTRSKLKASLKQITPERLHGVTTRRATTASRTATFPRSCRNRAWSGPGCPPSSTTPGSTWSHWAVLSLSCTARSRPIRISRATTVSCRATRCRTSSSGSSRISNVLPSRLIADRLPDRRLANPHPPLAVVAAVAVDLMGNLDGRVARAGRQCTESLMHDFRPGLIR